MYAPGQSPEIWSWNKFPVLSLLKHTNDWPSYQSYDPRMFRYAPNRRSKWLCRALCNWGWSKKRAKSGAITPRDWPPGGRLLFKPQEPDDYDEADMARLPIRRLQPDFCTSTPQFRHKDSVKQVRVEWYCWVIFQLWCTLFILFLSMAIISQNSGVEWRHCNFRYLIWRNGTHEIKLERHKSRPDTGSDF